MDEQLTQASWTTVILVVFGVGWLLQNWRVGAVSAAALALVGLLGDGVWTDLVVTMGESVVALMGTLVLGSVLVGIALVAGPRARRPFRALVLVPYVHLFVAMLPIVLLFGIGEASAVILATFVALPYFVRIVVAGLSRRTDQSVRMPSLLDLLLVAVNQSLMIIMFVLPIASIMGAGGLGRRLFQSFPNLDVTGAGQAGVAIGVVVVVFDRVSRPRTHDATLFGNMTQAVANHNAAEYLIDAITDEVPAPAPPQMVDLTGRCRPAAIVSAVGGLVGASSVLFSWNRDGGWFSAFARSADSSLPGSSFDGIDASGGSFFGLAVLIAGLWIVADSVPRILGSRQTIAVTSVSRQVAVSVSLFLVPAALLFGNVHPTAEAHIRAGPFVAAAGGAIAVVGASVAGSRLAAPREGRGKRRVTAAALALGLVVVGGYSGWSFDSRLDSVVTPEVQSEVNRLTELGQTNPAFAASYAADVSALMARIQRTGIAVHDGFTDKSAGLGSPSVVLAGFALGAAGLAHRDRKRPRPLTAVVSGTGLAIAVLGGAWILSVQRVAEDGFVSGVGAALTCGGGLLLWVANRPIDDPPEDVSVDPDKSIWARELVE